MARQPDHVRRAREELVDVVDHDPAWAGRFEAEAARLRRLLPPGAVRAIHHFGSTAVPGVAAKPIIDVIVEVPDMEAVRHAVAPALVAAGYEFFWRPTSPGDADIAYAWFIRRDGEGRRAAHVHALPRGPELTDRLAFRDLLRRDAGLRQAYADLKRQAAARFADDRQAYAAAKGRFVREALARAAR